MKIVIETLSHRQVDAIIQLAWHDRTSFDVIRERTGLSEAEVIRLMRRELEPRSFRNWRKRVSGRVTKHRKLLKEQLNPRLSCDDEDLG
ncbi:MAG: TIGR03643 family protein [Verrucomicrobiota bacterium]